jgi:hypothetical protein
MHRASAGWRRQVGLRRAAWRHHEPRRTGMSNRATPTTPSTDQLATFSLDVKYTRIASAFTAAGITTILLKGPAFDQLLFDGTRSRTYCDIDLLVDPARVLAAERLLARLGFRRAEPESAVRELIRRAGIAVGVLGAAHATAWIRDRDRFTVDLHDTVPEVCASAEEAWLALRAHRVTSTVVGARVQTLDRTASALLIALHAAHHGPGWNRARADLRRACEVLERDVWPAAALLARELRAEAAMGIGLGTVGDGRALAHELGLRTKPTPAYRLMWSGVAWTERGRA